MKIIKKTSPKDDTALKVHIEEAEKARQKQAAAFDQQKEDLVKMMQEQMKEIQNRMDAKHAKQLKEMQNQMNACKKVTNNVQS